jgi:hypothetical protein
LRQPGHLLAVVAQLAARRVGRQLHHLLLDELGTRAS